MSCEGYAVTTSKILETELRGGIPHDLAPNKDEERRWRSERVLYPPIPLEDDEPELKDLLQKMKQTPISKLGSKAMQACALTAYLEKNWKPNLTVVDFEFLEWDGNLLGCVNLGWDPYHSTDLYYTKSGMAKPTKATRLFEQMSNF